MCGENRDLLSFAETILPVSERKLVAVQTLEGLQNVL